MPRKAVIALATGIDIVGLELAKRKLKHLTLQHRGKRVNWAKQPFWGAAMAAIQTTHPEDPAPPDAGAERPWDDCPGGRPGGHALSAAQRSSFASSPVSPGSSSWQSWA